MPSIFISAVALYLLKSTLVAGFGFGYYLLVLRNAPFHPYNRWYLLSTAAASLLLPLLHLPASVPGGALTTWVTPAPAAATRSIPLSTLPDPGGPSLAAIIIVIYSTIAAFFLLRLALALLAIARLAHRYPATRQDGIRFHTTEAAGAPFSFGRRLFWRHDIPLDSPIGVAIFAHEIVHIRQRHTLDILALELIRAVGWCNPFLHLLLQEQRVVHEFIADHQALAAGANRHQYAEHLVWQSATQSRPLALSHSFFHTHLKRRITMIIKTNPGRAGYLSRVLALPLLLLLAATIATHAAPPQKQDSSYLPLLRFFNHHFRYPQGALDAGLQSTVWVYIHVDENGQMTRFTPCTAAEVAEHKGLAITVTSRPSAGQPVPPLTEANGPFLEMVQKTANMIGKEKDQTLPAGDFYFSVVFRIEKP